MKIGAAFPSTYLKAADLQGRTVTVVMERVTMEEIGGEMKPVLYFQGKERGVVLNKTNSSIIAEMYGDETDHWTGQPIVLHPARVEFQGRIVDAIRVKLVAAGPVATTQPTQAARPAANGMHPPPAAARPLPAAQSAQDFGRAVDDEIPF